MTAHHLAAIHLANLLAVVGRLDDAAALVATAQRSPEGTRRRGPSHLGLYGGLVQLAAGRLSAARATVEALPRRRRTGSTFVNAMRMFILAEVAARTDDRTCC